MITIQNVKNINDSYYTDLCELYEKSFTFSERKSLKGYEKQISAEKHFYANVILENEQVVGLINYWIFDSFFFIEHFTVSTERRGQSIGTQALKQIMELTTLPIVFEVDLPKNAQSVRRISFYERLNFYVLSNYYMQPPYENSMVLITMLIMTNDYHYVNKHYQLIKDTIYKRVYHYSAKI